jgi:hypothetical protein
LSHVKHVFANRSYRLSEKIFFSFYESGDSSERFVGTRNEAVKDLQNYVVLFCISTKRRSEQRYRAEFRFTSNGYRNRFRYRLGLSRPFGKERDEYKPFQIGVSNEIFFTDKESYFERNRILLAFNYKPSKTTTLQIGYLHQFDYKINDETGRDFLQIGYFFELFKKSPSSAPKRGPQAVL